MGIQGVGCNRKNPTEIFEKNVGSQYKCFICSGVCRNWPISAIGHRSNILDGASNTGSTFDKWIIVVIPKGATIV